MLNIFEITHSKILVAALDWGFGHTTRTSVLIKRLIELKNDIVFAGNESQINFIKKEFPLIETLYLAGYNIQLTSSKNTYWQLFRQAPKINRAIKSENKWLNTAVKSDAFNYIISDNRYGFYHNTIPSIILTHQISLQIPAGKWVANYIIKSLINHFSACWIPDTKNHSLSGKLSTGRLNIPNHFIGPLSRFNLIQSKNYLHDYLFMISGPEPECYQFFEKSKAIIKNHKLSAAIVIPFNPKSEEKESLIPIYSQLGTEALEKIINESAVIISKSGYTTIMDLVPLKKPMILIPTKGQYEQVFLGTLHQNKNVVNSLTLRINEDLL